MDDDGLEDMRTLTVNDLRCTLGDRDLVSDVSLRVDAGEGLAIVGASGSGKSLTLRALVGLLPRPIVAGGALTLGDDTYDLSAPARLAALRGRGLALLSQSAGASLDPTRRLAAQLAEVQRRWGDPVAPIERFTAVGLGDAELAAFPHRISGGEAQRAALALALACRPRFLLADEPTANLDTLSQARALEVIDAATTGAGIGLVLVTHDLALVAGRCASTVVLDAGVVVESGPTAAILAAPQHPATRRLVDAANQRERALQAALGGAVG